MSPDLTAPREDGPPTVPPPATVTSGPPGNGRQLAIPSSASSRTLGDHSLPGCGCSDKAALYAAGTPLRCGRGGLAPGEEQQDLGWTIQPPSLEDLSVSEGRAWSPEDGVTVEPHPHSLQKSWMTWNFGESQVSLGMMDGTAHEGSPPERPALWRDHFLKTPAHRAFWLRSHLHPLSTSLSTSWVLTALGPAISQPGRGGHALPALLGLSGPLVMPQTWKLPATPR